MQAVRGGPAELCMGGKCSEDGAGIPAAPAAGHADHKGALAEQVSNLGISAGTSIGRPLAHAQEGAAGAVLAM